MTSKVTPPPNHCLKFSLLHKIQTFSSSSIKSSAHYLNLEGKNEIAIGCFRISFLFFFLQRIEIKAVAYSVMCVVSQPEIGAICLVTLKLQCLLGVVNVIFELLGGWGVQSTDYALQYMNMI